MERETRRHCQWIVFIFLSTCLAIKDVGVGGHPTTLLDSAIPENGDVKVPDDQLVGDGSSVLADQDVIFAPTLQKDEPPAPERIKDSRRRSLPRDPARRRQTVRPDDGSSAFDYEEWSRSDGHCPLPAYPVNRITYCSRSLKRCGRDEDCANNNNNNNNNNSNNNASSASGATACCFNGCIFTCMVPMENPRSFDWVEETGRQGEEPVPVGSVDQHQYVETLPVKYDDPALTKKQATEGDTATADDDCHLSASQYQTLQDFRGHDGIRECFCQDGQILCKVGRT